ncbi:MAG: TRAP transporter substrate-binding protein DctP [Myxococcales bacterium]|nr:TRAP transporter substrate-binding protein DctP [Myxococcales bacterium]
MRIGLVVLGCLLAFTRFAAAEEMRIATLAPSGTPWMAALEKAAAEIENKTEGRVKVKYFPGGQQGDERDFVRKIRLGQLDGAAITSMGLAMIDQSILVLQLPRLFEDENELDYVAGKMWPYFQKKFEKQGFRLGERGEVGWIYFFSKNKVVTMDDLRQQKLWTMADADMATLLDRMKLRGVPLGIAEVDAALASGRINATFSSPLGAIALQWYSKVKYMNSMPITFAMGATVYSMEAQKRISPADQKEIDTLAKRNQKKARTVIRKANEDAKKMLFKKGITLVEPAKEMVDELTAASVAVQKEMTGKVFSQEELDMVLKHRDEYRAKNPKAAPKAAAAPAPAAAPAAPPAKK